MRSNATARRPAVRIADRTAGKGTFRPVPRPLERSATRVVNDRRWVHRNQLEIGMYVSELDRPWIETSFLFQGFRIDDGDVLRAVQDACEHARVDTEKLARVSTRSPHRLIGTSLRA